ncbi:hypothetical protein [Methanocella conradii]|nr:hypothetical protein [Methanocella conradii]
MRTTTPFKAMFAASSLRMTEAKKSLTSATSLRTRTNPMAIHPER